MRIDPASGSIAFQVGSLEPSMKLDRFLVCDLGRSAKNSFAQESWQHFQFDPEPGIAGTVLFDDGVLDRVFLAMEMPSDESGEWSELVEHQRKERHDSWLRSELGEPPYKYAWGSVESEYDSKGCASEIIVVYDR
jgi:hypothetical protein